MSDFDLSPVSLPGGDTRWDDAAPTSSAPQSAFSTVMTPIAQLALAGQAVAPSIHADVLSTGLLQDRYSHEEAIGESIRQVKDATGQMLENPFTGGYRDEAIARLGQQGGVSFDETIDPDVQNMQQTIFKEKLDALHQQYSTVSPGSNLDASAQDIANRAVAAAQKAQAAAGPVGGQLAGLAGGMAAMTRDPLQLAALFVGGGEAKIAKSVAGQFLETFARQGALNAAITAAEEPATQAWAKARGEESGLGPAMKEIGASFLAGGVLGTAIHGVSKLLGAAIHSSAADHVAGLDAPAGLSADDARAMMTDAGRRAEGGANLPEPPPWTPEGVKGERAEAALKTAMPGSAYDAADVVGQSLDLTHSALASGDRDIQLAGLLASLDPKALDIARASLAPEYAGHVAALVPEAQQASVMRELARFQPQSEDDAHGLISQSLDARSYPDAAHSLLGDAPTAADLPKPEDLRSFLRRLGGVADTSGDLKELQLGRSSRGLIRKAGMSLDDARRAAAEAGYLGHPDRASGETTPSDLIEAIRDHPRYSLFDAEAVRGMQERATAENWLNDLHAAGNRIDYHAAEHGEKIDVEWRNRAAKLLAEDPEMHPDGALEHAAIMLHEEANEHARAHLDGPLTEEIDHEALDASDREQGYGGSGDGDPPGAQGAAGEEFGSLRDAGSDAEIGGEEGGGGSQEPTRLAKSIISPAVLDGLSAADPLAKFPVEVNGRVQLLTREEMGQAAERANWLGQLIENCIL